MDTLQTMKRRLMYILKDRKGNPVKHHDYKTAILTAAKAVIPGKEVSFRNDDFLIDWMTKEEKMALEKAVTDIPELNGLELENYNIVFCELDGVPVKGKERFYQLAAEENRLTSEAFYAKYGPDANEDDIDD